MKCKQCHIYNNTNGEECCNKHRHIELCSTKHASTDWLSDIHPPVNDNFDFVEIRFKNGRSDFFRNVNHLNLLVDDIVAVEASPGHDIGIVSLVGDAVRLQMKRKGYSARPDEEKKVYRKAKPADIEKWTESSGREVKGLQRAREIIFGLNLQMKLTDVEFQGDGTKAIFYYSADDRVDFRELIKLLAEEFKVRIEMRQIGVRQESSRLGGIGSCGRELCCASWLNDFKSVSTNAARVQQLSLNPQKLAGQCAKLKCCLNYEYDVYIDAIKDYPNTNQNLKTKKGEAFHQKTDIFGGYMYYSYTNAPDVFIQVPVDRVKEIISMNKKNKFPEELVITEEVKPNKGSDYSTNNSYGDYSTNEETKSNY